MILFSIFKRKVNFADTDLAGIVHFSNVLRYVEEAEHAAMLEVNVPPSNIMGGFPKVHVDCDYRAPLRFGDLAAVEMCLTAVGKCSLKWRFSVSVDKLIAAEGNFVTVYLNDRGESTSIPEEYRTALLEKI